MKEHFRKTMAFILILVLAICISACAGQKKEIEEAVLNLVAALKSGDMDTAGKFIDAGELKFSGIDSLDGGDQVLDSVFEALECEIVSSEKKSVNEATVKAKITTLNLTAVLGQSTMKVLQEFAMGEIGEDDIDRRTEEIFKEFINSKDLETATTEVSILVKNAENGWRVVVDKDFQNAISGGFLGAVNNAQSALFKTE